MSNQFKGTPGPWYGQVEGVYRDSPWSIEHDTGHDASWAPITTDRGRTLAIVVNDDTKRPMDFQDAEMHANAALIAAAPRLYAALARLTQAAQDANVGYLDAAVAEGWDALEIATSNSN